MVHSQVRLHPIAIPDRDAARILGAARWFSQLTALSREVWCKFTCGHSLAYLGLLCPEFDGTIPITEFNSIKDFYPLFASEVLLPPCRVAVVVEQGLGFHLAFILDGNFTVHGLHCKPDGKLANNVDSSSLRTVVLSGPTTLMTYRCAEKVEKSGRGSS
ncbi:hypothetical protein L873DRAFT_342051 [Choiromyces venosus 120613-1]|uniref:Uncharacterized protein n=1 Tax=Choiromyces venosus 120613-1 TaxID=1336337 RepID=A0A3N4J1R4_9PEZI|nr:hypothetical protein L873DRAFT_342051 [Choiromyces venosus 120613-1]